MFTGIVEAVGSIAEVKGTGSGSRIRIYTPLVGQMSPGDSLAVNGVCLTVIVVDGEHVMADIGPETERATTLSALQRGQRVNLERPMRFDSRLGGHLVLGHVDGIGTVRDLRREGESQWLTVAFAPPMAALFIRKGSVAVDGVSLTVAGLSEREFDVQIIPYTWANTTLSGLRKNDKVNLECDVIGKYVVHALELRRDDVKR